MISDTLPPFFSAFLLKRPPYLREFVSKSKGDALAGMMGRTERGSKLRILNVIDEYTQKCLAIRVALSIPASVVIETLEWLFLTRGVPKYIRSDNGPEFTTRVVCQWLAISDCQILFRQSLGKRLY